MEKLSRMVSTNGVRRRISMDVGTKSPIDPKGHVYKMQSVGRNFNANGEYEIWFYDITTDKDVAFKCFAAPGVVKFSENDGGTFIKKIEGQKNVHVLIGMDDFGVITKDGYMVALR
jgi:hypothetical protein